MDSLFDMLTQQLGGDAVGQISRQLGIDQGKTQEAIPAALASIMGGLSRNAGSPQGVESLAGALASGHDGGILDDLVGSLAGGPSSDGAAILGHVFGNNEAAVESGLSRTTGLDAGSVQQLLAMLAPIVMGALGRTQRQKGLDPSDLASMLGKERQQLDQRAPGGMDILDQLLDSDGDGQVMDDVAKLGAGLLGKLLGGR